MASNFNRLSFQLSPSQIQGARDDLIGRSRRLLDEIAGLPPAARTFESTFLRMAQLDGELSPLESSVTFPGYVHAAKEVRDASTDATKALAAYEVEASMRVDVYDALKEVPPPSEQTDRRLYDKMMEKFTRNGLHLPEEKRVRIAAIQKELSQLGIEFQKNLAEDKTTIVCTKEDLRGMSDDFLASLKRTDAGEYVLPMDYPVMFPVLKQCAVEATRQRMEFAYGNRCKDVNSTLLQREVELRAELAEVLGFENFSDYILKIRMAKEPKTVSSFLSGLREKLHAAGLQERQSLLQLMGKAPDGDFVAWDYLYAMERLKEREYSVNEDEIAEYFPLDHVLAGMFDIYQRVFGVRFVRKESADLWHPDVQYFEVFDQGSESLCGAFYLDLFPREGKYNHAAVFPLQYSCALPSGGRQYPVAALVCNFSRPSETRPSLLKHSEVITTLHEFGHCAHNFLSKSRFALWANTSVGMWTY